MLLLCGLLPASAGAPTESEIPAVGTEISGFVVLDTTYLEDALTDVVKLEHQKTGATLFWMANDNINRSFMISFRTPVYNDTGLAHVFEHASLDGSEKYPGTGTYDDMQYKTLNTFLNAYTYQFVTQYPMASTSEDQLLVYMDYYLDGVFHPLVLESDYALMQEAYRYELPDAESEIALNGTVYNEMKGVMNIDEMALYNFEKLYGAGSYRTVIFGGDPDVIPELTMEDIRTFHETYYHPSNSMMVLTGDVELERFLEKLDRDFLSGFEGREPLIVDDPDYVPLEAGYTEKVFEYPAESGFDAKDASIIIYAFPVSVMDIKDNIKADVLAVYLSNEDTPFKKAAKENMPNAAVSVFYDSWLPGQPAIRSEADNVNEDDKTLFKQIVDESIRTVLDEGIDESILSVMLKNSRYDSLLAMDKIDYYLTLGTSWGYYWGLKDGNIDAGLELDHVNAHLEDYITAESMTEAFHEWFDQTDTSVMAITVPVPGKAEEKAAALREELDAMKASMTPEEIDALVAKTAAYHQWLDESASLPFYEELNAVSLSEVPEEIRIATVETDEIDGVRVYRSELDTPLIYVNMALTADTIPFESFFDYEFYTFLIGDLSTENYPREALANEMNRVSRDMMFSLATLDYPDNSYAPKFTVSWYTMEEDLDESFALAEEILFNTVFTDYDSIRATAAQRLSEIPRMFYSNDGFKTEVRMATQAISPLGRYNSYLYSEDLFNYLSSAANASDEEMDALVLRLEGIRDLLLNRNGLDLFTFGSEESMDRVCEKAVSFASKLDASELQHYTYDERLSGKPYNLAYACDGSVVNNIVVTKADYFPELNRGVWNVVKNIVSNELLLPEIRYKGGAYGAYTANWDWNLYLMYTYRDPKVGDSYAYMRTVGETLQNMEISDEDLESYQIAQLGNTIFPEGPFETAKTSLKDAATGKDTYGRKREMIGQIKAMTTDDIAKYSVIFDAMSDPELSSKATFGSKSLIEASADEFGLIDYHFLGSDEAEPEATEIMDVLSAMSAEDIAEMLSAMDPEDLQSLMSYTMDYFTDEDGNIDFAKVFALVGENLSLDWSNEEIEAADEALSDEGAEEPADESVWNDVLDSLFEEIDMQQVTDIVTEVFDTDEEELENLVSGIVGAFMSQLFD